MRFIVAGNDHKRHLEILLIFIIMGKVLHVFTALFKGQTVVRKSKPARSCCRCCVTDRTACAVNRPFASWYRDSTTFLSIAQRFRIFLGVLSQACGCEPIRCRTISCGLRVLLRQALERSYPVTLRLWCFYLLQNYLLSGSTLHLLVWRCWR